MDRDSSDVSAARARAVRARKILSVAMAAFVLVAIPLLVFASGAPFLAIVASVAVSSLAALIGLSFASKRWSVPR
jgi:hypothetical protein